MITIKKKDWIEIVLHVAFWGAILYTLMSLTMPHIKMRIDQNGTIVEKDISHSLSSGVFYKLGFLIVLFYVNSLWLLKRVFYYKNVLIRIILPLIWFSIIFLADNYFNTRRSQYITKFDPAVELVQQLAGKKELTIHGFTRDTAANLPPPPRARIQKDLPSGNRLFKVADDHRLMISDGFSNTVLLVFIVVFGLSIAYFFLKEWARTEKIRSELEAVQLDTEIKFLRSQVNPHFFFNTLNNLFSMALKEGKSDLADRIAKLSNMMRYMLYESNGNVSLEKEINCLNDYIALHGMRYAPGEVDVTFQYPEAAEASTVQVAPMLFIPFLENAFKHGVAIGHQSNIALTIALSPQKLTFTCENIDHSDIQKLEEEGGIGLQNVKRRLQLLYPGKHTLKAGAQNGKYIVNLQIDLV